jgi:hypothetical protein
MRLRFDNMRQWGQQALAHCTCSIEMALGIVKPKRASFPYKHHRLTLQADIF